MYKHIAAIDIGSNSIRVAIIGVDGAGRLEVLEEGESVQRLVRDVRMHGFLSDDAIEDVVTVLADYVSLAKGAGAETMAAVATSAVREAPNGGALVDRVRERLGLELVIASGHDEAALAFLGAVHSLPVEDGLVLDVGGGSIELAHFRGRRLLQTWTLPLGAVRLADDFIHSDPPSTSDLRAIRDYVFAAVQASHLPRLASAEVVVGTGGTIRNLAKIARASTNYPLPRLHGYVLNTDALEIVGRLLETCDLATRSGIDGLNPDRADSIVAGVVAVQAVVEAIGANALVVSGQGLREGIALEASDAELPSVETVRRIAVQQLRERFAHDRERHALRRVDILNTLLAVLPPLEDDVHWALFAAAKLLDIGRSIDYYSHHRYTETLLLAHGLPGYSHREQALVCTLVRQAPREKFDVTAYRPLVTAEDRETVAAASALLAVADEVDRRLPAELSAFIAASLRNDALVLSGPLPDAWDASELSARCERALGRMLVLQPAEGTL